MSPLTVIIQHDFQISHDLGVSPMGFFGHAYHTDTLCLEDTSGL